MADPTTSIPGNSKPGDGGWSVASLLLIAALVGGVGGVGLASRGFDERPAEEIAEEEVDQALPEAFVSGASAHPDMSPDPRSLAGIPPYPDAAPRKLTSRGTLQNTPAAISWFETDDPPERVLAYYFKAFEKENRRAIIQQFSPTMGYAGWMEEAADGGPGLLHMVSVMKQYRKTMVLLSASRPEAILNAQLQLPGGIKLPDGASPPTAVSLGEDMLGTDVMYSSVENMSGPEVVTFFKRQFQEGGFTVSDSTTDAEHFSVVGKKNGTSILVAARTEGQHVSIVLTYSRSGPQELTP